MFNIQKIIIATTKNIIPNQNKTEYTFFLGDEKDKFFIGVFILSALSQVSFIIFLKAIEFCRFSKELTNKQTKLNVQSTTHIKKLHSINILLLV